MNSVNLRRKLKRHRRVPYEEPVPSTLRCARCEGPAEGALQHILCGCRFCAQPCAAELEGRVCLGGTSECAIVTADQLLPDRGARRELGDLKVRCDHCNGIFFRRQWSRHNEECKAQELATLRKKIEEGKEQSMADQLQLLLTYTQMTAIPTEKWSSPKSDPSDDYTGSVIGQRQAAQVARQINNFLEDFNSEKALEAATQFRGVMMAVEERLTNPAPPPVTLSTAQQQPSNRDGVMVLRLHPVTQLHREIVAGQSAEFIESAPFHLTTENGEYRFTFKVYLNGCGAGRGSHVSAFLVLHPGPHDAVLRWPLDRIFCISVESQKLDYRERLGVRVQPDPASAAFRRPRGSRPNNGAGCPKLAPQSQIFRDPNFVKDDTLFIRVAFE